MRSKQAMAVGLAAVLLFSAGPAVAKRAEIRGIGQYTIPTWFKQSFLNLGEDVAEATRAGKRLLVYFGQDGCPYCAELFNNNFSQPHIVEYTRRHFDAIDINMWGNREVTDFSGAVYSEKEFAARYKVSFTPTILFFDDQGRQVLRLNGYRPPHQFLAALRYVAERQEGKMSFREYLARHAPPPAAGRLHDQPFFARPPHDLSHLARSRPVAVFFEQKACQGCDHLHTKIFTRPETLEQIKRFHVVQLDRWSDTPVVTPLGETTTARRWADTLNITYVPSAVLFNEGKEVARLEALFKAFHVQSVLDYAASGAYQQQPSLQRFLQERSEQLRESGIVVDLWE
jgi:thioredoxin-related protein